MKTPDRPATIRRVLIVGKRDSRQALPAVRRIARLIEAHGIEVFYDPGTARALRLRPRPVRLSSADLCVVVGGDGTLLSAARAIAGTPRPILGINLGGLGFMAETGPEEADSVLNDVLAGRYTIGRRMTLEVSLLRAGRTAARQAVLNDVVISKTALSRMIDLNLTIDRQAVTRYRADGLIVSTPTGSTAYSLSAGGPIIHPEMSALLITPICPHTLSLRPLVVPDRSKVEVTLDPGDADVYLTLDGQVGHPLRVGDRVRVRQGPHPVLMVHSRRNNYFEVLRRKLRWGAN